MSCKPNLISAAEDVSYSRHVEIFHFLDTWKLTGDLKDGCHACKGIGVIYKFHLFVVTEIIAGL